VKPFDSEIVSKLTAKTTSSLTKNTAFEHKFQFDTRKRLLFRRLDLEENIEETCSIKEKLSGSWQKYHENRQFHPW
jgi:hypothetical protein